MAASIELRAVDAAAGKNVKGQMAKLRLYLLVSLIASWTIWLWPFHKPGSFYLILFGIQFGFPFERTKLVFGICVPGLLALAWTLAQGEHSLRLLLSTLIKFRAPTVLYFIATTLPWVLSWTCLGLVLLYFPSSHPRPSPAHFLLNLVLLLPFGPLWEEIAWRGFVLRTLQSHYAPLMSGIIVGCYWAVWHIPLWLTTLGLTSKTATPVLVSGLTSVVAWSIIFTYLYNRAGQSLPVVILLHASYDSANDAIFTAVQAGQLQYIGLTALLSACLALALASRMRKANDPGR